MMFISLSFVKILHLFFVFCFFEGKVDPTNLCITKKIVEQ
jgi:hypothetical protein